MSADTRIYCLFASLKGEEPGPWLIAAEDEYAWEGDEARCKAVFEKARAEAEESGWDVREVVLLVDYYTDTGIAKAFLPPEITAEVRA